MGRIKDMFCVFRLHEPRSHMAIMTLAFWVFGLSLIFQGSRYANTPAYANLLAVLPAPVWGAWYTTAAVLKTASIVAYSKRLLVILTHTVTVPLLAFWQVAFLIRYISDPHTTPVNVVSWTVFLYLVVRSALQMDAPIYRRAES